MTAQAIVQEAPLPKVVLIDDDHLFRESLSLNLAEEGYAVTGFPDGESAMKHLGTDESAAVVLLDWRMPGLDGLEVLQRMRERNIQTPVIFLTGLSEDIYEESALKWGAVDFIDKSRRLPIILQRLRIITERVKSHAVAETAGNSRDNIERGNLELLSDISQAFWKGEPVDLTRSEFEITRLLVIQVGSDISFREIYDTVRGKDFVAGYGSEGFRTNVRSFIKRVRNKFRDVDPNFDEIENYPGFGYRWRDQSSAHTVRVNDPLYT